MFAAVEETQGITRFVTLDSAIAASAIFVITYAIIASERIHKTVAALAGAAVMLIFGLITQEQAFEHVDWNVIFLLFGMMIIAGAMRRSGVFQWLAIQSAKWTRGEPVKLMAVLLILTAIASALLDNVTTVVLIGPITIFLASRLQVSPIPFLIAEILASNIGGMATLIGDPPNLIVGSAAGFSFIDFLNHMLPVSLVLMVLLLLYAKVVFRKSIDVPAEQRLELMQMDAKAAIVDPVLARRSVIVLIVTILGFVIHGFVHLEPATIAMAGAALLMVWGRLSPHESFEDVEWAGLFFFVGLFIVVGALLETGVVATLADQLADWTGNDPLITSVAMVWFAGIASGIIDNIPLAAAMVPIVHELSAVMDVQPIWWSLALGADLGGNLTAIGASANVILISLAEREGHKITFRQFLVHGVPVTLVTLVVATFYVWGRYFLLA
ncbi:MAG: ArsB/NhaD family transporter [Chloroflexi bacterium]|nr:ArsB/NhaD family transporter [Chloroflexota bacterium]MCY3939406.1 ArsB/NhaD family transporter [Chloroflexota bacterium]